MFNDMKLFLILISICNAHNHSLIFICLWLSQNVIKPPFTFYYDHKCFEPYLRTAEIIDL